MASTAQPARRLRTLGKGPLRLLVGTAFAGSLVVAPAAQAGSPSINWTACEGSTVAQCGVLQVPVDWSKPGGEKIAVGVARRPASDPAHRLGTLFYNPGGPDPFVRTPAGEALLTAAGVTPDYHVFGTDNAEISVD